MPGLWDAIQCGPNTVIEPGPVEEYSTRKEQLDILHLIKTLQLSLDVLGPADRFEMGTDVQHRRQGAFVPCKGAGVDQVSHARDPTAHPICDRSGNVAWS